MKRLVGLSAVAGSLLISAGILMAQEPSTTQQTTTTTTTQDNANTNAADTHSNVRTLTGCLQKGEDANEYDLVGQDGSTWELKGDTVDLPSHVGQTVTITGAVRNAKMHGMKEDAKQEAQEHGMDKSGTEHGHLTVTNLTQVSSSCTR